MIQGVSLVVVKATPALTWPIPSPITYGAVLSNAQLDATVDENGQFTVTQFHLGKPAIPPRNWDADN